MLKIIDKYIKRGIKEVSTSAWNGPDCLVKLQHSSEETLASKGWRVVKDSSQPNTTIFDKVFVSLGIQQLKNILGNDNKTFGLIDLRKEYHQLPPKDSDCKKTTFRTEGLAEKM
jgi:hypothetical protein